MRNYFLSLMLFISALGAVGPAVAGPVVATGSSYSIFLRGSQSGAFLGVANFDDTPAAAFHNGLVLTLSESETELGAGTSRITINLSASGDLFPFTDEQVLLAIGVDGNGLDLITQVSLDDARITFRNAAADIIYRTENLAGDVPQNDPWDGFFPAPANAFAIDDIGGRGVTAVTFDFFVTEVANEVPEPGSIVLCATILFLVFAVRRKKRNF